MQPRYQIAVDIGGTFTDGVLIDTHAGASGASGVSGASGASDQIEDPTAKAAGGEA